MLLWLRKGRRTALHIGLYPLQTLDVRKLCHAEELGMEYEACLDFPHNSEASIVVL